MIPRDEPSAGPHSARRDLISSFEMRVDNRLWGGGPSLVHYDIAKLAFYAGLCVDTRVRDLASDKVGSSGGISSVMVYLIASA